MTQCKKTRSGFTLIELLVVMAIIAILVGITLGVAGAVNRGNAESKAKAEIGQLQLEIELYKADEGSFPPVEGGSLGDDFFLWYEEKYGDGDGVFNAGDRLYETVDVSTYLQPDGTMNPLDMRLIDPWGREYYYDYDSDNPFVYTLGSEGADGDEGTADDITNRRAM